MCGRYAIYDIDGIGIRYDVEVPEDLRPNYNAAPTQVMPVLVERKGTYVLEYMKWGIPRVLGKDIVKELINTRSDKALGRFWKKNVTERRCLIPANAFYEWKKTPDGKKPYYIQPENQGLFSFAGIWSEGKDDDGNEKNHFSIMTTEANEYMNAIHDRMPVMLLPQEEQAWLNVPAEDENAIMTLLHGYKSPLKIIEATEEVNSVRNNHPGLIPQD